MNTRFTLPVAVAVAVHATLLFGFRHSAATPTGKPLKEKSKDTIFIVEPEKPEAKMESDPGPKGSPEVERPSLPESTRPLTPVDIPMESTPDIPRIPRPSAPFSADIPGHAEGVEGGVNLDGLSVVSAGLLDNAPNARVQASPDYPFAARKDGLSGEVMVEFEVDETGKVSNPVVVKSTARIFDEPSLRAVLKWRFEPGRRDGRVVRFRMAVPVVFNLGDN